MRVMGLLFAVLFCASASAQDTGELWGRSRFTYGQFNIDGESVDVTYHRVGRFTYGYYGDGSRSTTTKIGNRIYTDMWTAGRNKRR